MITRRLVPLVTSMVLAAPLAADSQQPGLPLVTPALGDIQAAALELREQPEIVEARDKAIILFKKTRSASLADGLATLEAAVDELVFGVLLGVAANDPCQPRVVWSGNLPYTIGNKTVPGSRYADGPDRIYRSIPVNPAYRYTLTGTRNALYPSLDFSFEAIPPPSLWGMPTDSLQAKDIEVASDGTFTITADAGSAQGRVNHLHLAPGTNAILIRDTLSDWSKQRPNGISVSATVSDQSPGASSMDTIDNAVSQIIATAQSTAGFLEQMVWKNTPNQLTAFERKVDQGMPGAVFAASRFALGDDEVLVIALDPLAADYLAVQISDLWMRSASYDRRHTSLNNQQAIANPDGSFTLIVSRQDPGYINWLDTDNLHDGIVMVRWELISGAPDVNSAVREIQKLPLSELDNHLAGKQRKVSAQERQALLDQRYQSYLFRLSEQ
ncbi:MAG: hypothetical protein VR73_15410 [Gammaproteobacteria bacterium BRH_c0]|nr:MAG: hypothetical protein VR73_15410 [Gammaproteobacteria bacterium BRH_c0]